GAVPLLLAEAYSWNFSYAVMSGLMTLGMAAVLIAPREGPRQYRPIHDDGLKVAPVVEFAEWFVRFSLLALGAIFVGSGLAASAAALEWLFLAVGANGLAATVVDLWKPPSGVWF